MTYSILLVDDEQPSVEAMYKGVNWDMLHITSVYTAYSANQARKIFENHEVNLMICDIEMPKEDGISLTTWVHEHYPDTLTILLTCHADFKYAQQSVKIGVFDYVLKPIPYDDMEGIIKGALAQIETLDKKKRYQKYGLALESNKEIIMTTFLKELIREEYLTEESMKRSADKWELDVDIEKQYMMFLLSSRRKNQLEEGLINELQEFIKGLNRNSMFNNKRVFTFSYSSNEMIVLYPIADNHVEGNLLKGKYNEFIKQIGTTYNSKPCLYGAISRKMKNLHESFVKIQELIRQNVAYDVVLFFENDNQEFIIPDINIDYEACKEMLLRGQGQKLYENLKFYINKLISEKRLSEDLLILFYHNFIQLLYSTLADREINVKSIFTNYENPNGYRANFNTAEEMLEYLYKIIINSVALMNQSSNKDTVIKRVKTYIQEHIKEEINRDEIADYVFLNPEYLSRLFRKETGVSLKEYIIELKLQKASELLLTSNLSITEIAYEVGYTNLPYFSKVFKNYTGVTPNEYRKK